MTTLTEFLLARLADLEALAKAALEESPTPWVNDAGTIQDAQRVTIAGYAGEPTAAHIVCHDPARVLTDVAAKRAIVSMSTWISNQERVPTDRPGVYDVVDTVRVNEDMEPALFALATVYADHPDFDEGWRP